MEFPDWVQVKEKHYTLGMAQFYVYQASETVSRVLKSFIVEPRQYLLYFSGVNS